MLRFDHDPDLVLVPVADICGSRVVHLADKVFHKVQDLILEYAYRLKRLGAAFQLYSVLCHHILIKAAFRFCSLFLLFVLGIDMHTDLHISLVEKTGLVVLKNFHVKFIALKAQCLDCFIYRFFFCLSFEFHIYLLIMPLPWLSFSVCG